VVNQVSLKKRIAHYLFVLVLISINGLLAYYILGNISLIDGSISTVYAAKTNSSSNLIDQQALQISLAYNKGLEHLQRAINNMQIGSYNAEDYFTMVTVNNNSYWQIKDFMGLTALFNKYKLAHDTTSSDGQYILKDNKILLFQQYSVGKSIDVNASLAKVNDWLSNLTDTFPFVINDIQPKVLSLNKEILDFTKLAGSGMTRLDLIRNGQKNSVVPYSVYGLLEVDNLIVYPHKEFSYLDTIQPQSNGLTKDGKPIAAGICNSTTTIFRAVLNTGYKVTDRSPHENYVPSYEWGYPYNIVDAAYFTNPRVDFKFVNDSDYPILLKVSFTQDKDWQYNKVSIYTSSKAPERKVELTNWKIWDKYSPTKFKGSFDRSISIDGKIISKETFFSQYF